VQAGFGTSECAVGPPARPDKHRSLPEAD